MEILDRPIIDNCGVMTIAEYGGWFVQIMPMIFNDRLVLVPIDRPMLVDYGWCYQKGGAAALAVLAWNPDIEAEPTGYIKAIGKRTAGEHA